MVQQLDEQKCGKSEQGANKKGIKCLMQKYKVWQIVTNGKFEMESKIALIVILFILSFNIHQ
jgi:hypothetical protein